MGGWKGRAVLTGVADGYFVGSFLLGGGGVLLITIVTVVVHELPEGKIPWALHAASFTSLTRLVWSLSEKSAVSLRPTQTRRSRAPSELKEKGDMLTSSAMEKARRWSGVVGLRLDDVELAVVICGVDVEVICADKGTKGG